jgi:hypothetical protein
VAALNPGVLKIIRRSPLGERMKDGRMFFNLHLAVEAYVSNYGVKTVYQRYH